MIFHGTCRNKWVKKACYQLTRWQIGHVESHVVNVVIEVNAYVLVDPMLILLLVVHGHGSIFQSPFASIIFITSIYPRHIIIYIHVHVYMYLYDITFWGVTNACYLAPELETYLDEASQH